MIGKWRGIHFFFFTDYSANERQFNFLFSTQLSLVYDEALPGRWKRGTFSIQNTERKKARRTRLFTHDATRQVPLG